VAVIKERGQKGKVVVDIVQGEMTATCMKTSFMSQKFFFPAILDKKIHKQSKLYVTITTISLMCG
jgi:hypothetical protein